jgi:hypothetical protein
MTVAVNCDFEPRTGPECLCPIFTSEVAEGCSQCVQKVDPYVGLLFQSYVSLCQSGLNFEGNSISSLIFGTDEQQRRVEQEQEEVRNGTRRFNNALVAWSSDNVKKCY